MSGDRVPRRKAAELRPETAAALAEVLASILVQATEKAAEGDYLLTVKQVAARWSVGPMFVRQLIYSKKLKVVQLGAAIRVRAAAADEYVRVHEGPWRRPLRRVR